MIISLIAAVAKNGVIGKDNDLVWNLPDDMKYFMKTTEHHCVLGGRKNYESIPEKYRPLKNRTNIVVTRQAGYGQNQSIKVVHDITEGIKLAENIGEKELFVIGGGEIYQQSLPMAHRLYITEVKASFEGDTFFPTISRSSWTERSRIIPPPDKSPDCDFHFTVLESI